MFKNNKYSKWYYNLITKAQLRPIVEGYSENHHILPRSLGGTNVSENLVRLTLREHFVAHMLLFKMTSGENQYSMLRALIRFSYEGKRKSKFYEKRKIEFILGQKFRFTGERNPNFGGKITSDPLIRAKMRRPKKNGNKDGLMGVYERTSKIRLKISVARVGKGSGIRNAMAQPENRLKVSQSKIGRKRIYQSDGSFRMVRPCVQ